MNIRLNSKEQEELVIKNRGLVYHIVNKFYVSNTDYEDIVSIGTIGLVKAAATFNSSKKIKFATYATHCIRNEILMYFRKKKLHIHDISLNTTISTDDEGNTLTLDNILIMSSEYFTEQIEAKDIFEKIISIILNVLQPHERLVMLYKISGNSQRFIAETLNVSQSYISKLEKKSIEHVKLYFYSSKEFDEIFSVRIINDLCQISFYEENVKQFNKIFEKLLQKLNPSTNFPGFKVHFNNERIIMQIPIIPESFSLIAEIFREIDSFTTIFASNKNTLPSTALSKAESDVLK